MVLQSLLSNLMKTYNIKYSVKLLTVILSLLFLTNSCGLYKKTNVKDNPINDADKRQKNINEGKGIRSLILGKKPGSGSFDFASSNEMWRATLDILDFIPLSIADYGGGIIITDWYSDKKNEAIKISVRFLSNEIRADGLDITIHKKNCVAEKTCDVNKITGDLNTEIKLAILRRASLIRKGDILKLNEGKSIEEITVPRSAGKKD